MIIVNRMFSGTFLENELGHEAINLFRADNGEHYIYVNPYGIISKQAKDANGVLLLRRLGSHRLEVLGYAAELECLIRDEFFTSKEKIEKRNQGEIEYQKYIIKKYNIRYGGVFLDDIYPFDRQTIYATFKTGKFKKPKDKMYIVTKEDLNSSDENSYYLNLKAKQSLKEYIYDETILARLNEILNNSELWVEEPCEQITDKILKNLSKKENNFLKIIGKENDELAFSNWIAYVLRSDKELFEKFCSEILGFEVSKNVEILREYENIDIYIKDNDKKFAIVLENKIKSDINGIRHDLESDEQKNQLDKYEEKAKKDVSEKNYKLFLSLPNHHKLAKKDVYHGYTVITYKKIYDFFEKQKSEVPFYKEFLVALKDHSREYRNELYDKLNERLCNKIMQKIG